MVVIAKSDQLVNELQLDRPAVLSDQSYPRQPLVIHTRSVKYRWAKLIMNSARIAFTDLQDSTDECFRAVPLRLSVVVNTLCPINKVNRRQARLLLGWATVRRRGKPSRCVKSHPDNLSLAIPPRQWRRKEYQRKPGRKEAHRAMH